MGCLPQIISSLVVPATAIVLSIIALVVSVVFSRRSLSLQVINDLYKEYRSADMFVAVKALWDFFGETVNLGG